MTAPPAPPSLPVIQAHDVFKSYKRRRGGAVRAVDGVSFTLNAGEALGIVGESGCGKSTLARLLVRLESPTAGTIELRGQDIARLKGAKLKALRRQVQIVFQDPYSSLNPRMTASAIIGEALTLHPEMPVRDRHKRVLELLGLVGLSPEHAGRYPHQFSGGQRQRIGIARALALEPRVLVLDEPVSALDVSVQAQVINLLEDLRGQLGLSYVLISHDLSVVGHTCDRVAVMYLGKIVEIGPTESIFNSPSHPYTVALLSAVPGSDLGAGSGARTGRIVLKGDIGDPARPPSGCRFRERCWQARDVCVVEQPDLLPRADGVLSACHFPIGPS